MKNIFANSKQNKFRKGLILYSIFLLGGLFIAQIALLVFQPAEAAIINTGIACSGQCGSGASCNSLVGGNPNEGHMYGCYDLDANGSWTCYQVPTNSTQGLPGCYLDCSSGWQACGCDVNSCENACRTANQNSPAGHYTYSMNCSGCGQRFTCGCDITPTVIPPTTVTPEQCPSTQARFTVGSHGLVSSGTYLTTEIPPFQYSVLINGDVNQKFQGVVTLSGPFGSATHDNGNTRDVPQPWSAGTYTLRAALSNGTVCDTATVNLGNPPAGDRLCTRCTARTDDGNVCENMTVPETSNCPAGWNDSQGGTMTCDDFIPSGQCPVVTVTPTPENPDISVTKVAIKGSGPYQAGTEVPFRINITNTGNTTLTAIHFRDQYSTSRLQLLRIVNAKTGQDITSSFSIDTNTGTVVNNDLTIALGDLGVGQNYLIDFVFRALLASNQTCNDAFVIPAGGKGEENARACISIVVPPTDI